MKKGSIKNTRVNVEVRKEIQNVVTDGIRDPRISAMTAMTDAYVAADLRYCIVYVSMLDSEQEVTDMFARLKSTTGFAHSEFAHSVNLRIIPELRLILDESMAYGAHIDKVLGDLYLSEQVETKGG